MPAQRRNGSENAMSKTITLTAEGLRKIEKELVTLEEKKGEKLTSDELAAFYENVDHRLYSEVNGEFVDLIFETFEEGLNK